MTRGCIMIKSSKETNCGISIVGGKNEILTSQDALAVGAILEAMSVITYPLCKIAEKLGVQGIPEGQEIPDGVWISDGSKNGTAYNWPEMVDKMTERMGK